MKILTFFIILFFGFIPLQAQRDVIEWQVPYKTGSAYTSTNLITWSWVTNYTNQYALYLLNNGAPAMFYKVSNSTPVGLGASQWRIGLAWDKFMDPTIVGFKVYWGLTSGNYAWVQDTKTNQTIMIINLQDNTTYHFVAVSYNAKGVVSDYSNEISFFTFE